MLFYAKWFAAAFIVGLQHPFRAYIARKNVEALFPRVLLRFVPHTLRCLVTLSLPLFIQALSSLSLFLPAAHVEFHIPARTAATRYRRQFQGAGFGHFGM